MTSKLLFAALAAFLAWACVGPTRGRAQTAAAAESVRQSFASGGRTVRVDFYAPATAAAGAAPVLVLHGAGGMVFDGGEMRRVAQTLAAAGFRAYVVHYFNRTGTLVARDGVMQQHFDDWLGTVRDAIGYVHGRENGAPVGIYGYSLGAFLAVAAAGDDRRVGAVVEQAGGVWNNQERRLGHRLPSVFMVHGEADQRVPVAKYAEPLRKLLRERGAAVETRFVPGEGHGFSPAAQTGVRAAAAGFFIRRLPSGRRPRGG